MRFNINEKSKSVQKTRVLMEIVIEIDNSGSFVGQQNVPELQCSKTLNDIAE